MKVLILGSGGREHALAWAVKRSVRVTEVVCAPGNGGIAQIARCVPVDLKDLDAMVRVAVAEQPGLTIVGPELPLSLGIVDALQQRGLRVFGPTRAAAMLETSKGFAKRFLQRHNIPTANYAVCTTAAELEKAIDIFRAPIVVKADGLAAGKGVIICPSRQTAIEAAHSLFSGKLLGEAAQQIILEEFLEGDEISFLCLSDGKHVVPLAPSQDHKCIGEGDTGPNTGGMGAYSPASALTPAMEALVLETIVEPTLRAMREMGAPYRGVLYAGLMLTAEGPKLIEYNARLGDPEAQVILPRLENDLLELMLAAARGALPERAPRFSTRAALTVVLAAKNYPATPIVGTQIRELERAEAAENVIVTHAGTKLVEGKLLAAGGRVLNVTALADTVVEAHARAYAAVDLIDWSGGFCRRDIGWREVARERA